MSRNNLNGLRVGIAAFGLLSGLLLSGSLTMIAIIALAFLWRAWEAPFLGLIMDFISLPVVGIPFFTIGSIILVWLMEPIRKEFLV